MEPYLNLIKVKVLDLQNVEINFLNYIPTKRNNLYQDQDRKECWIHNPQINEVFFVVNIVLLLRYIYLKQFMFMYNHIINMLQGPLIISIAKNGTPVGATMLHIKDYIPSLLKIINC